MTPKPCGKATTLITPLALFGRFGVEWTSCHRPGAGWRARWRTPCRAGASRCRTPPCRWTWPRCRAAAWVCPGSATRLAGLSATSDGGLNWPPPPPARRSSAPCRRAGSPRRLCVLSCARATPLCWAAAAISSICRATAPATRNLSNASGTVEEPPVICMPISLPITSPILRPSARQQLSLVAAIGKPSTATLPL